MLARPLAADLTPFLAVALARALTASAPATDPSPGAVGIVKKLRDWLGITYDDLAVITGISRSTFFDWMRTARSPHPATTHDLLRVYAMAKGVVGHLGTTEAAAWFRAGQPSPLELLRWRDFDAAERAASEVLFRGTEMRRDYAGFAPEAEFDVSTLEPTPVENRVVRRARRVTRAR